MTAEKVIDNKVIILQKNAGYSLEHVVVLWYTEKSEKCKERSSKHGKQTQTAR